MSLYIYVYVYVFISNKLKKSVSSSNHVFVDFLTLGIYQYAKMNLKNIYGYARVNIMTFKPAVNLYQLLKTNTKNVTSSQSLYKTKILKYENNDIKLG